MRFAILLVASFLSFAMGFVVAVLDPRPILPPAPLPERLMAAPAPYVYPVRTVIDIHDGDTMTVLVDLGFDTMRRVIVRLSGVDTPEVTGAQKVAGKAVRDWVVTAVGKAQVVVLESKDLDKYGRSLAVLYLDGKSLNATLVGQGMALTYDGGDRAGTWTPELLAKAADRASRP